MLLNLFEEARMAVKQQSKNSKLVALLNQALGWELRAQAMYAHYAAYVKGLESLTLAGHFDEEAAESVAHAKQVRDVIAMLGGEAVTARDQAPVVHTENTRVMLQEALKTEAAAADVYRKIVPLVKDNAIFFHSLSHIMMDEMKAVVEMENLLSR
jgi:bacterioferritin (cytochrome b1)